ncbi:MAG: gamma-glutamyltransferase [Balneolia bacterium]|nr:gamma-glutamyltransferase [Balneolia bacterium]
MAMITPLLLLMACGGEMAPNLEPVQQPEEQLAERFMIAAANDLAVEAGLDILRKGGNAVDAAVAVQMMLSFTEPAESGIGGGAFMMFRNGETGEMMMFDGRETAPASATSDRFKWLFGRPMPLYLAVPTGASVGVPGTVAMLYEAHQQHGFLPWSDLFEAAIQASAAGVPYPDQLKRQVERDYSLQLFGDMRRYFVYQARGDEPVLKNEALSQTLAKIAEDGPSALLEGEIAAEIVEAARARWPRGSDITMEDLAGYEPKQRDVVCGTYRGHELCGPAPPSSGGITVLQILGMLERFDLSSMDYNSAEVAHLIAEASRLAFADRAFYIGDPDFTNVPVEALINPDYLLMRSELIDPARAMNDPKPGSPLEQIRELEDITLPEEQESEGTTHFSIVDEFGNWVSMTSSIEVPFGSRIMTNGFLLNNQLTDFSFVDEIDDKPHPNRVEGGKRPRSSMSPFFVMDPDGEIKMVVGSRGGSRIIGYVTKTIIGVIDYGLPVQEAIILPNILHRGDGLELEFGTTAADLENELREKGHRVNVTEMESGIHGIEWLKGDGVWRGGADPRIRGFARGE